MMNKIKNEIVLFEEENIKLEVNIKDDTVWLNRQQISELFDRDIKTIGKHINNVLKEELETEAVVAKFATTANDNKIYQMEHYNLDMIISIGYRVKSKRGIKFRKWATKILKEYLLQGYVINQKRLNYLEKTIKIIEIANRMDDKLLTNEGINILKIIGEFTKALNLLDEYDYKKIKKPKGTKSKRKIDYKTCIDIIKSLKFKETSSLFALERDNGLDSIINNIYQSFDGKELYNTLEEKAANLLYLIVKNHVFIDGNKRIAAIIFIYFLDFYDILKKNDSNIIDNNTLVAIVLLIAESNPREKEIIIDLVMNFLSKEGETNGV